MRKNVSDTDRTVRFFICGLALAGAFSGFIDDSLIVEILFGLAIYTLLSGLLLYCPLYHFLYLDTRTIDPLKKKSRRRRKGTR